MEVGVVEGVDVGAQGLAEGMGQFALVVDGGDRFEMRVEGGEAMGFDGGFVHVGVVEVGDLALIGACGGVGFGGISRSCWRPLEAEVGEGAEDADGCAVGRNFGALDQVAVGVEIKVVARPDGGVHVGDSDAVSRWLWRFLGADGNRKECAKH